jgi:hypothetical protein
MELYKRKKFSFDLHAKYYNNNRKVGDGGSSNIVSYDKNTNDFFSNQKIKKIKLFVCNLIELQWKFFYLLCYVMGQNLKKKKIKELFSCYFPIRNIMRIGQTKRDRIFFNCNL